MFTDLIEPRPTNADGAEARTRFMQLLGASLAAHSAVKLVLGKPGPQAQGVLRVQARPITLRGEPFLQLVYRHPTQDITKNIAAAQAVDAVAALLGEGFASAHLTTHAHTLQLTLKSKGGKDKSFLQVGKVVSATAGADDDAPVDQPEDPPADAPCTAHNREKQRPLQLDDPVWSTLGVSHLQGHAVAVVPAMARKWKQINKFTELFGQALLASPLAQAERVRVIDFGCGKGYLTVAMHAHLQSLGKQAAVAGVELRPALVDLGNQLARQHDRTGLRFEAGDVRTHEPEPVDVMVALHACDTATDHAIHLGLRAGASIIMCSPCCHKEIRPQMSAPAQLRPLLQHGVHLGQEAEMVTDSLRALLLEAAGYEARIFEFVSLEHTNKNKMILAVRRPPSTAAAAQARADEAFVQVDRIKAFYGLREQCLERLMRDPPSLKPNGAKP